MRFLLLFAVTGSFAMAAEMKAVPAFSVDLTDPITGVPLRVRVEPFLAGATEVTQQEYEAVTGQNPSHYRGPRRPVDNVSWWDAIRYCNLASVKENLTPCYDLATGARAPACTGYRLPREAEWDAALGRPPSGKADGLARLAHLGLAATGDTAPLMRLVRDTGTRDAASLEPNAAGLYDMLGNVWEWCEDWYNAVAHPPSGPLGGVERLVKGGSFVTPPSSGARAWRASLPPERTSRFTGFRVVRSSGSTSRSGDAAFFDRYNSPPAGFESETGGIAPLFEGAVARDDWLRKRRPAILRKWRALLGAPELKPFTPAARVVQTISAPEGAGTLLYLQVEPDFWEKVYILKPVQPSARPLSTVIVPYYDVDIPAGQNLGGRTYMIPPGVRAFAQMAVRRGYIAVAIRWFGESYGERYAEAVANLNLRHPKSTGLGKWVWDSQRLLDYLETLPDVDGSRMGIIGHSLGAKMSLYAAAMDERISAVVFSEGGIGLGFSNYEDYWYLGDAIRGRDAATDQHELLGLIAPRPFLLIAGESADSDKSWHFINAARPVYKLFGDPRLLGMLNHRAGHTPTPDAVRYGFEWLDRFLQAP